MKEEKGFIQIIIVAIIVIALIVMGLGILFSSLVTGDGFCDIPSAFKKILGLGELDKICEEAKEASSGNGGAIGGSATSGTAFSTGQKVKCEDENGDIVGEYQTTGGGSYKVYKTVQEKFDLVQVPSEMSEGGKSRYLNRSVLEALKIAWENPAMPRSFVVTSAYRSCEHQRDLYKSKRKGDVVARPEGSRHGQGTAADLNGVGTLCTMGSCSISLVRVLESVGMEHLWSRSKPASQQCTTEFGDKYQGRDCVHFQATTGILDIKPPVLASNGGGSEDNATAPQETAEEPAS